MSVQAAKVFDSVVDVLKTIPDLSGAVIGVYDDAELLTRLKAVTPPAVGVIYEGMRSQGEGEKASHHTGIASVLGISIVLVVARVTVVQGVDTRTPGMELLDAIRQKLIDTKSPVGGFWRFIVEAQAVQKDNVVVWVQRWETPVKLTRENSSV